MLYPFKADQSDVYPDESYARRKLNCQSVTNMTGCLSRTYGKEYNHRHEE